MTMKEIAGVLNTARASRAVRLKAQRVFLTKRSEIWKRIQDGRFPDSYLSSGNRRFVGAPRRTRAQISFDRFAELTSLNR
jgi:hypothetical protein